MKIKFKGMNELIVDIGKKAVEKPNEVKNVVKTNGAEMQQETQGNAPVDTGFLKRDVTLKIEDNGFTARVKSNAEYAPYQEYGTRYQPGTPHVRPAFHEQAPKFIKDLEKVIKD